LRPTSTRSAAVAFVFVTIVLDILALGMIIPVLPKLVESFVGGDSVTAAEVYGLFGTVWALMQFVFSPLLGALSDRFGRRPIILISNFGLGFDYILMAMAPSIAWLFVGRMVSGITAASISTANAYIADVTPPEKRANAFGLVGAAFGLGFVLGPALGGVLGSVDPHLPFWVAAGLSLANGCWGLFVLPESLPVEKRSKFTWKRANPVGSLRLLTSRPNLLGLSGVNALSYLAHEVLPSVFVLYTGYRYGWDAMAVGLCLALVGVCSALVQGGLIRVVSKRVSEATMLTTGLFFGALGFLAYGLATETWQFWLGVPLMALWGLAGPATQGLMTRCVSPGEQGLLQGAQSSVRGMTGLIGPLLFTQVYALFIGDLGGLGLPGAPFLLAGALTLAAMALAFAVTRRTRIEATLAAPAP